MDTFLYSEDENEFVGADSLEASGLEDFDVGVEGMELGNVTSQLNAGLLPPSPAFEAALAQQQAAAHQPEWQAEPEAEAGPAIPTSWPIASKGRQRQEGGLPLVLFDLNGVLMQHHFDGRAHHHDLRPGVHHLLRLLGHYRLGVYTSSTRGTVQRALTKLAGNLHNALQQAQRAQHGHAQLGAWPAALPEQLFHVIMCREHCLPMDKKLIEERGGKPWDTVKPLHRYFADLSRVLLVDDSPHKSLPAEAANMLVMPRWHGPGTHQGKSDLVLPTLVDALLRCAQAGLADVRHATAGIAQQLAALVEAVVHPGGAAGAAWQAEQPAAVMAGPSAAGAEPQQPKGKKAAGKEAQQAGGPGLHVAQLKEDPQVASAMRVLYMDAMREALEGWACRPTDVQFYMDAALPGVGATLGVRPGSSGSGWSRELLEAAVAAGQVELGKERSGRHGQWLRLGPGAAVPPPERLAKLLEYAEAWRQRASAAAAHQQSNKKAKAGGKKKRKRQEEAAAAAAAAGAPQDGEEPAGEQPVAGQEAGPPAPLPTAAEMEAMRQDVLVHCLAQLQARGGAHRKEALATLMARLKSAGVTRLVPAVATLTRLIEQAEAACFESGSLVKLDLGDVRTPRQLRWNGLAPGAVLPTADEAAAALQAVMAGVQRLAGRGAGAVQAPATAAGAPAQQGGMAAAAGQAAPLLLAVFEDRGPGRESEAGPSAAQQPAGPAAAPAAAEQEGGEEGQDEAPGGGLQPGQPTKTQLRRQRKQQLLVQEALELGLPPPAEGLSKSQLSKFKHALKAEQQRREQLQRQQGQQPGSGEGAAAAGTAGAAGLRAQPAQPAALSPSEAEPLRGGHFLRSCGSMPLSSELGQPALEQQQAGGADLQPPCKRARHEAPPAAVPAIAPQQQGGPAFSSLHYEVLRFAQHATPTPEEVADVQRAVEGVAAAASSLWPESSTVLFGSQATGLALPGSDLDIVILNVGPHIQRAGTGFTQAQRKALGELLEDLLDALLGAGLIRGKAQLIEARVPIIKACLAVGPGLMADISLGASNGAAAVEFVRRQVLAVPPLRPLCLVAKAFLRERGLNEVFTGGLSSYTVFNMVMAHLQREGFAPAAPDATQPPGVPGALPGTFAFLSRLASSAAQQAQQAQQADLGALLWGFYDLFGLRFGYSREAVSIRLGGVTSKIRAWRQARRPWLLAVEDPQEPGRDIASGSFGIKDIQALFASAAELLAEVCEDAAANAEVEGAAQQAQQPAQRGESALGGVVNVEAAVGRGPEGIRARRVMAERAAAKSALVKQQRFGKGVPVGKAKAPKLALGRHKKGAGARGEGGGGGRGCQGAEGQGARRHQQAPAAAGGGGRKRGSKRTQMVEAQWGSKTGNFVGEDYDSDRGDVSEWSLRKQKKGAKRKGAAGRQPGTTPASGGKRQKGGGKYAQKGGGGGKQAQKGPGGGGGKQAQKAGGGGNGRGKRGRGGWVTDSGAPATGRARKRQRRQQE